MHTAETAGHMIRLLKCKCAGTKCNLFLKPWGVKWVERHSMKEKKIKESESRLQGGRENSEAIGSCPSQWCWNQATHRPVFPHQSSVILIKKGFWRFSDLWKYKVWNILFLSKTCVTKMHSCKSSQSTLEKTSFINWNKKKCGFWK